MADQGRWFKLWVSAPDDPHLDSLPIADYGRWAKFGAYLKEHGTNGTVTLPQPCPVLQAKFQVESFEAVLACITRFPNCSVTPVTNSPVAVVVEWKNWSKYQGDFSGDRVRRHRDKKRHGVTAKEERRREEKRSTKPPSKSPPLSEHFEPDDPKRYALPGGPLRPELVEAIQPTRFAGLLVDPDWWRAQFRAFEVDVEEEVRRAEAWCVSNPRKAPRHDLKRFLHRWFQRAQEIDQAKEESG